MLKKIPIHIIFFLFYSIFSFTPSSQARTYWWYDFTIPHEIINGHYNIVTGSVVIFEVDFPDFITKYKEIPLVVDASGGRAHAGQENSKILTVNNLKNYYFNVPFDLEVTRTIKIETKYLKEGKNYLQFKQSGTSPSAGYGLTKLTFDVSGLENFEKYYAQSKSIDADSEEVKKAPTKQVKKDNNPPEIIITSHQVSRDLKIVEQKKKVKILGKVTDENSIVEILVNGKEATFTMSGDFEAEVYLGLGNNEISVSAMDRFENRGYKSFTIVRKSIPSKAKITNNKVAAEQYYALIIGNNSYRYLRKLQTAIEDAKVVDNLLKTQFGFQTTLLLDVGRDEIIRAINNFRRKLKYNDNFLIYYAGHGEFDKIANKAYWLPIDAKSDDDTDWIIADTITSNIKRISSNHVIIVSDSCYSGTFTRRSNSELRTSESRSRYLEKMRKKKSRTLLASGGNEPVSDIGGEGHSVFANAFIRGLKNMDQNEFTAEELYYQYIKELVSGGSEQTPEYNIIRNSGHMGGDFYFKKAK